MIIRPEKRKEKEQLAIDQLRRVHDGVRKSACVLEEFA